MGDRLLREIGARLLGQARDCTMLGRLSSDEFMVLLLRVHGTTEAGVPCARGRTCSAGP